MTELEVIQQRLQELEIIAHKSGLSMEFMVMAFKRQCVISALQRNGWNQCKAAAEMGRHRNSLSRDMQEMGINRPRKSA